MNLGFIGFGKMAKAIANGLLSSKPDYKLYCYDIRLDLEDFSFSTSIIALDSLIDLEQECDILIFSVKPKDMESVVKNIKGTETKHYISIAAGISTSKMKSWNPKIKNLSRVMPNMGAFSKQSVSAIYSDNIETLKITQDIFKSIGITIILDNEDLMHAITGLSGSGPAYVFLFLQSLIEAGIREGLSYEIAYQAALYTIYGSIQTLIEYNQNNKTLSHPANWIIKVASPGGTTIEGLEALEEHRFKFSIYDAVHKATEKSKLLGKQ